MAAKVEAGSRVMRDEFGPSPDLLPDRPHTGEESWHLLRVMSRQEKVLATILASQGVSYYLPLTREIRYHGSRKARVEIPLFPGYLFLWGSLEEAYSADRTRRVAAILRVEDQSRLEWELRNLNVAIDRSGTLAYHATIECGMRVRVRSGPFRGVEGLVQCLGSMDRLILQVRLLANAVALEIDGSLLDILE